MYFEGINYSHQITIKNLLQHKSGIRYHFTDDERFFKNLMNFPDQNWNGRKS
jgi:CubicO group peptidase (beta-lactamase class C family)